MASLNKVHRCGQSIKKKNNSIRVNLSGVKERLVKVIKHTSVAFKEEKSCINE